jgi:NADP-dependent 3-hydroxy acid dehydrogenase YdfG
MIKDFEGKAAVVTGAASVTGRLLAHAFVNRGMRVILADINKEVLEIVGNEHREITIDVLVSVTDISDRNQVAELAEFSYDNFESVNILCNNAGDIEYSTVRNMVGLFGTARVAEHFVLSTLKREDSQCKLF